MKIYLKLYFYLLFFFLGAGAFAGTGDLFTNPDSLKAPKNWFLLDPIEDGIMGTGAQRAHNTFLKDKRPARTVIVAVIDSGVDMDHEDLKGKIWVNEGEIPGNGIDDDGNGYVDDVHGWNFIGGEDGTHVAEDSHELTREFVRLREKFEDADPEKLRKKQKEEYAYWKRIKENFESSKEEAEMNYGMYSNMLEGFRNMTALVKDEFEVDDFDKKDLSSFEPESEEVKGAIEMLQQLFSLLMGQEATINEILSELEKAVKHFETQAKYAYNPDFDPRHIVGDDPENYKEKHYGNNDPIGPDASHGTHVAGIIAADRKNDLGIEGIAEHVLIMPIRAVPNGDERDKDIANAIRYAVDNGAHIINMSFGKSYSPGKKHVDKAVKYAERKGVVLIHAAGNSAKEINPHNNYPNRWYERRGEASGWIEVGAASWMLNENLPASFSNFSSDAVDLFAPGVDIYSTMPGSEYDSNSGTSMAAPSVSGVAALLMAYYPDLKPKEIKEILKKSVYSKAEHRVIQPGQEKEVAFGDLSITGGLVNAYQALEMAESMSDSK
ncbi:S8 family peptidase [Negadavirga shengliensis]|uniref:S8 family peptidase n=1 Tax=Negadavirga shengliensis TaxID=1389218 RepID=A0ABV9T5Z8_9BACT